MKYYTLKHFTCNLNNMPVAVSTKYVLPNEEMGKAKLVSVDCEIAKMKPKGMTCPIFRETNKCPFRESVPESLDYPY